MLDVVALVVCALHGRLQGGPVGLLGESRVDAVGELPPLGLGGCWPDNFITLLPATNIVGTGSVTYTAATDETNVITVDRGVTAFTIPLQSFIRWGATDTDQDQDFTFTVDSNSTVLDDDGTLDYTDGREPVSRNTNNASASQHIDASPATPRITVTY